MDAKPYLIFPKLIEQPTWGGSYILELKNWLDKPFLEDKKIGQSYELFGGSKLATHINDSRDFRFSPEIGSADNSQLDNKFSPIPTRDYTLLADLIAQNPVKVLGKHVHNKYGTMPLLIKINQAYGNSFQLHIKPNQTHPHWKPKPESWYYFEDGLITCGIKDEIDIKAYKTVCELIEGKMSQLSALVQSGDMDLAEAKKQAKEYIKRQDPWQFVNTYDVKKYDLVDLSAGGIHHSWEENREKYPNGNIVYEVQVDVMDPICTIRSFDQGKFKDDGSIRNINIEDYFQFIDTDKEHNDINNLKKTRQDNSLLRTDYYCLDILEVNDRLQDSTGPSFCHLYVRDGDVEIMANHKKVRVTRGHSCFLPQAVGTYEIKSLHSNSVVLKTYIS